MKDQDNERPTEKSKRLNQQAPVVVGEIYSHLTIGGRIRYMREVRGMNQVTLAEKCELTQAAISNLETDVTRKPSGPSLLKLASALDANPDWIMSGIGHPDTVAAPATSDEIQLMRLYRRCNKAGKATVLAAAKLAAPPESR